MARAKTVILGNLEPNPDQIERVRAITPDVVITRGGDPAEVSALLAEARHVIACNFNLNPYLAELRDVELVVLAETGIACLDAAAADRAGVRYTNLPGYSSSAVVQYALRCLLESVRPWDAVFGPYAPGPRDHKLGRGVDGLNVGLIGFGSIGREVAAALAPLGARVHATARRPFRHAQVPWLPLELTVRRADALIVCCDRNPTSIGLLDARSLNALKRDAIVISVAHRSVFQNDDLRAFVHERPDVHFWLDFDPDPADDAMKSAPRVHLSPHLAFFTQRVLWARVEECIHRLEKFHAGREWRIAPKIRRPPVVHPSSEWAASPLEEVLRIASRFYESASLFAALELGVFDAIGNLASLGQIAERCHVPPERLAGLLRSLVSLGVLEEEWSGSYAIPARFQPLLARGPGSCVAALEALHRYSYGAWGHLSDAIRGEPLEPLQHRRATDPSAAALCTAGSEAVLGSLTSEIVRRVELKPTRILDLGCGSAALTRRLLHLHSQATAQLIDTSSVLENVRQRLDAEGLASRCELRTASYHDADAVNGEPDLILLLNVLHMETPDRARALLARCARQLRAGGKLVAMGYFFHDVSEPDPFLAHFSLSCELLTEGGACHSLETVASWLRDAGCHSIENVPLTVYRDVLVATKQHDGAHA